MKYKVRKWTKKDLPFIRKIALASGLDGYSNILDKDNLDIIYKSYYDSKRFNKIFKNRIGFVGIKDDGLVGYLVLQEKPD